MEKLVKNIPSLMKISKLFASLSGLIFLVVGNINLAVFSYVYGIFSDIGYHFLEKKFENKFIFNNKFKLLFDKIYDISLIVTTIILGNLFMIFPLALELVTIKLNKDLKKENIENNNIKTNNLSIINYLGLFSIIQPYLYITFFPILFNELKKQIKSIEKIVCLLEEKEDNIEIIKEKKEYNYDYKVIDNKKINNKIKKLVRKKR